MPDYILTLHSESCIAVYMHMAYSLNSVSSFLTLQEVDSTESAVTKLFASARNNSARLTEVGPLTRCMHVLPSEGQIQVSFGVFSCL